MTVSLRIPENTTDYLGQVGELIHLPSDADVVTDGLRTWIKSGHQVLASEYPDFPIEFRNKNNMFNFTNANFPLYKYWNHIAYGNGMYVVMHGAVGGTTVAVSSPDGINWTQRTVPNANYSGLAYGMGRFVAIGRSSNIAAISTDGITWTQQTLPSTSNWNAIIFVNNKFICIAKDSANSCCSSDGITWTTVPLPSSAAWQSIAYGNSTFVAISSGASSVAISSTPNDTFGNSWTTASIQISGNWADITFGNGLFVMMVYASNICATSKDGKVWTVNKLPVVGWWKYVKYFNGIFIMIQEDSGSGNVYLVSDDGINWTVKYFGLNQTINCMCYNDTVKKIVGIFSSQNKAVICDMNIDTIGVASHSPGLYLRVK